MNYMEHVEELKNDKLKEIDGGRNAIEYLAYGLGYLARVLVENMPETGPSMGRL